MVGGIKEISELTRLYDRLSRNKRPRCPGRRSKSFLKFFLKRP